MPGTSPDSPSRWPLRSDVVQPQAVTGGGDGEPSIGNQLPELAHAALFSGMCAEGPNDPVQDPAARRANIGDEQPPARTQNTKHLPYRLGAAIEGKVVKRQARSSAPAT